jgi:hypothetical protein
MKKLILFFLVFAATAAAQVFDEPIDSTEHYILRQYEQDARVPAEILNEDKDIIDSVMYSLIVWTDSLQFTMVVDTNVTSTPHLVLKISNYATGTDTFVTTAQVDTFTVNVDTLNAQVDLFWIQSYGTTNANDVLGYTILSPNKVIVNRPAAGSSGLIYNWRWIKRY